MPGFNVFYLGPWVFGPWSTRSTLQPKATEASSGHPCEPGPAALDCWSFGVKKVTRHQLSLLIPDAEALPKLGNLKNIEYCTQWVSSIFSHNVGLVTVKLLSFCPPPQKYIIIIYSYQLVPRLNGPTAHAAGTRYVYWYSASYRSFGVVVFPWHDPVPLAIVSVQCSVVQWVLWSL